MWHFLKEDVQLSEILTSVELKEALPAVGTVIVCVCVYACKRDNMVPIVK